MPVEIKPWELNPSEKRTEAVAQMLMKVGYEPRRAYQMASKISGLGETVGEFTPGVSYELSQERGESPVNMALLDMLPGALVARKLAQKAMRTKAIDQELYQLNAEMQREGSLMTTGSASRLLKKIRGLKAEKADLIATSSKQQTLPGIKTKPTPPESTTVHALGESGAPISNVGVPGLAEGLYKYKGKNTGKIYDIKRIGPPRANAKWKVTGGPGGSEGVEVGGSLHNAKVMLKRWEEGNKGFRVPLQHARKQIGEGLYKYRGYKIKRIGGPIEKGRYFKVIEGPTGPIPEGQAFESQYLGEIETKISDLLGPGYKSGGLVMNYGDYGRSYK
jgi:hypothetical protein